jgi:catechol 2,3-dioxygenase-like lactoylglutathione lyase family enzyme
MRLEAVQVPVGDVDRAVAFYRDGMAFAVDHDTVLGVGVRLVQLTPPGSACSIQVGSGLSDMAPGSLRGLTLVVEDVAATRDELAARGVDAGEVRELGRPGGSSFRFLFLSDPDGNAWAVQEERPA